MKCGRRRNSPASDIYILIFSELSLDIKLILVREITFGQQEQTLLVPKILEDGLNPHEPTNHLETFMNILRC